MTSDITVHSVSADEVFANVWRRKWIIAVAALSGLILAVAYNHTATPRYTIQASLAPVTKGQFDGRMAALGVGLPNLNGLLGGGNTEFNQLVTRLTSPDVATLVMQDHELLTRLAASRTAFNATLDDKKRWVQPMPSALQRIMYSVRRVLGREPYWTPPSPAQLADYLNGNLKVSIDRDSGLATLELEHTDPQLGEDLLNAVIEAALTVTRQQRQVVITEQLAYVRQQLQTEALAEVRRGLTANLEQLLATEIDIRSRAPVVGQVFEAARATERPTHPKVILNAALGLVLGALISAALILAHGLIRLRSFH